MSESLGVAESTIRQRYRKLSGFITGFSLVLNPHLTGENIGMLNMEVPSRIKENVLEKLNLVDDVVHVTDFSGAHVSIVFYCQEIEDTNRKVALLSRIAECGEAAFTEFPFPPYETKLSRLDLQIIAYRQNMSISNEAVAKELGISTRTLNRRCNKLASGGAVWPVAHLTIEGLQEGVYAFLEVSYLDGARGESVATIRTIVEDFLIFDGQFARYSVYNLLLPGIASARNILEKVKTVRGIKYARIDFAEHDDLHHELFGRKVRTLLSRYDSGNRAPIASNLE
jgi:DNA-binding Lrp family transcriptional regulator